MRRARSFGAFLVDFVIGDDPLMFVLVCLGIGATAVVESAGMAAWWLLVVVVLSALTASVLRARRTT
jgi:hypothetical protein